MGASEGIPGIIIGLILDIFISLFLAIFLTVLLWLGINAVVGLFILMAWFHHRSLRYLVTRGRRCRENPARSVLHGFLTAALYGVWLYGIVVGAHWITRAITG